MSDQDYENTIGQLDERIDELEAALQDAIDSYEECAGYKGDYLFNKHGDAEEIARLRTALEGESYDAGSARASPDIAPD